MMRWSIRNGGTGEEIIFCNFLFPRWEILLCNNHTVCNTFSSVEAYSPPCGHPRNCTSLGVVWNKYITRTNSPREHISLSIIYVVIKGIPVTMPPFSKRVRRHNSRIQDPAC
jgi:hypothetical protein